VGFSLPTACARSRSAEFFVSPPFVDSNITLVVPSFTKGIITIGCNCQRHANPVCDGMTDIRDLVATLNPVLRAAPINYFCPETAGVDGRTDVDCNGLSDVADVVRMVGVVFDGADPAMTFRHPCGI
jgi:hypothetical protein